MVRRFNNKSTYQVWGELGEYAVTMERLNNDLNGNPRWAAELTIMDHVRRWGASWTVVYRFNGHYFNENDEAKWIVKYHEEKEGVYD